MTNYVTVGKDTVYSVAMILETLSLRGCLTFIDTDTERFDFVDSVIERIAEYFYDMDRERADIDRVRAVFVHGIRAIQYEGWPIR